MYRDGCMTEAVQSLFDAFQVQDAVDQTRQTRSVSIGDVEEPARFGRDGGCVFVHDHVQRPQYRRERRAQLVANGGEELGLATLYVLAVRDIVTGTCHAQGRPVFRTLPPPRVSLDPLPVARR